MAILLDKVFFTIAVGHLSVDFLSGQRYVFLTYVITLLGLSNATLGFIIMVYTIMSAFAQPVFGYLADRLGARLLVTAGLLWMGGFYILGTLMPGVVGVVLFVLAGLGSGAFHPAATMVSTQRGRTQTRGRETTATAIFFLFGQAGLFLAPLAGGHVLERSGTQGLAAMGFLVLPVALLSTVQLRAYSSPERAEKKSKPPGRVARRRVEKTSTWGGTPLARQELVGLVAFALVAAFQSWTQQNIVTYVPKYLHDLGQTPSTYGLLAALFMGGSALGNVLGGYLADRFGKRVVVVVMLALASVPLVVISMVGWSPWLYVLLPLAGALTGATFSVLVVLAQRIIPVGLALAAGLILGFYFTSGSLGSFLSGYLIDVYGFNFLFQFTAGMALVAAVLALTIRDTSPEFRMGNREETAVRVAHNELQG